MSDFFGRERELKALRALVERPDETSGSLLIVGAPGSGKSTLISEFSRRNPDVEVVTGGSAPGMHGSTRSTASFLAVRDELLLSAAGPTLVAVDDVARLDPVVRDALLFVARRRLPSDFGIVFLLDDINDCDEIFSESGLPSLHLSGLDARAARELADRVAPHPLAPSMHDAVFAIAQGNPRWTAEVVTTWPTGVLQGTSMFEPPGHPAPSAVAWITAAVNRLPPATARLLDALAVIGDTSLAVLNASARDAELNDLSAAELSGLVIVEGHHVRLADDMTRAVILASVPPDERRGIHLRVAQSWESPDDADLRAWHRAAAADGVDDALADELETSIVQARRRGGPAAVAAALEKAAGLTSDPGNAARRRVLAALSRWRAGDGGRAESLLSIAEPQLEDDQSRTTAAFVSGVLALGDGHPEQAFGRLIAGATWTGSDPSLAAELSSRAAGIAWWNGRADWAALATRIAASSKSSGGAFSRFVHSTTAAGDEMLAGRYSAAGPILIRALPIADGFDDPRHLMYASEAAGLLGDDARALRLLGRAVDLLREAPEKPEFPFALELFTFVNAWHGRLDAATNASQEGLRWAERMNEESAGAFQLGMLAHLAALRGAVDECRELAARAFEAAKGAQGATVAWALGRLELGRDRPADALRELLPIFEGDRHPLVSLYATPDLVEAAVDAGQPDHAVEALARFEEWAESGSPWARIVVPRLRALVADPDPAVDLYFQALATDGATLRPFDYARANLLLGRHLRRLRRRLESREHLRTAASAFGSLGLTAWAERARSELRASGETISPLTTSDRADLTVQEEQVARLVAVGASNREVAQRLHLSPRTVEYHLAKVYVKLGISSRSQLAGVLP
jgi:DNA-binding CsgD family transcriptional regulator